MKGIILIFSCLLLILLIPMKGLVAESCASDSVTFHMAEGEGLISDGSDTQTDILYDDNVLTLLTTYDCQNDDVVPCRLNRLAQQLRVMTSRIQLRLSHHILAVKRVVSLLSAYYSNLLNHISQGYSTLKLLCWQYSVDCYVFAFRQILI